jgi:RHS repeat-associated protein
VIPPMIRGRLCFIGGGVGEHFAGWQNGMHAVLTYFQRYRKVKLSHPGRGPLGQVFVCAMQSLRWQGSVITQYVYDAEGVRIAKGRVQNLSSCDPAVNGFQLTSAYVIGPSSGQLSEYATDADGDWEWQHTNVWAGGQLLATYQVGGPALPNPNDPGNPFPNSTLHFYLNDPLGTRRMQTDYAGVVEQNCQSLPYGDGLSCAPPGGSGSNYAGTLGQPTEHHFTGKERDSESGNDYFGARYYASTMGRFSSPDPSGLYFANQENPQSLNLYSYVLNNPMINVDPDGRECVWDDGSYDSKDDKDTGTQSQCESAGGHYVDPTAFATLGLGDWSDTPNSTLVGMMGQLQDTQSITVTATSAASDLVTSSVDGLVSDFIPTIGPHDITNLPAISTGDPYRLFSTRYCGPGGAGATTGFLDAACKAHDTCYKAAGISAANNGPNGSMTPAQSSAATACNQALYNAARLAANAPGSKAVRYWLTQGANVPFAGTILRPGTEAKPW